MEKTRKTIDQTLCDHVRALQAGGLTLALTARYAGIGEATVSRIKAAGYNAQVYQDELARRRKEACMLKDLLRPPLSREPVNYEELEKAEEAKNQPAQLTMDLEKKEEPETDMAAAIRTERQKLTRFQAEKADEVLKALAEGQETREFIATKTDVMLLVLQAQNERLNKIYDLLGQLLRKKDG